MTVSTRSILESLLLPENWDVLTDEKPAFTLAWPGVDITVARMVNMQMQPIWNFGGKFAQGNSMGIIDFEMPLETESREQTIAWMADALIARTRLKHAPEWLVQGLEWREQLPWVRRQLAYQARERCSVDRDWFRLPCKTMRQWAETGAPNAPVTVQHDGGVLRITGPEGLLAMPARGEAWSSPAVVALAGLRHLPKRLTNPTGDVSKWDGHLYLWSLRLPLTDGAEQE